MTAADTIYDRYGQPILRMMSDGRLLDFYGQNIGFIEYGNAYNYSGQHVGWYEGGLLRDHSGYCVGFGENVTGTPRPLLPLRYLKPLPGLPQLRPLKPLKSLTPLRPLKSFGWSNIDPLELFLGGE